MTIKQYLLDLNLASHLARLLRLPWHFGKLKILWFKDILSRLGDDCNSTV